MLAGKRAFAFTIDWIISIFSGMFVLGFGTDAISLLFDKANLMMGHNAISSFDFFSLPSVSFASLFFWILVWPSILLGFLDYKFKKTLGKLLFKLEVISLRGYSPSFGRFFGRELLKFLTVLLSPLWVLPLTQVATHGTTFYDKMFGTDGVGKVKLTKTQKEFKRHYK